MQPVSDEEKKRGTLKAEEGDERGDGGGPELTLLGWVDPPRSAILL